ncbi:MAG: F0F1 ATP synthase subunit B' [Marinibacterium sp.]
MATETVTEQAANVCVNSHGGAVGMPQLCAEWLPNQIFWLVITLIVIYLILSRVALPRIAGILADRAGTITNDLAAAEDLKAKAVEAEKAYERALADARAEAQKIAADTRAEIQAGLDDAIAKADQQIAAKAAESEKAIADIRAGAIQSVREVASETAASIVAALGGSPDAKAIDSAIAERVKG